MNELATFQANNLPAQPSELAKFILIMPEKIKAMKAEIMAIQKAQLAKEVYDQKKDELDRVRELMLLAYARMGAITREIPTSPGQRTDREPIRANATGFEMTKKQVLQDLGFSKDQVSRMEQMAAHPDIVEEVIVESQAGQIEATQGEVLRRIKERSKVIDLTQMQQDKFQAEMDQIDRDTKNLNIDTALDPYLHQIAEEMRSYCENRKTVVFLPLVRTSQKFRDILNAQGFKAAEVNGNSQDRAAVLQDFEEGKYNVLCNSMLLTEGWDCPSVDCVVVLRPTKVRSLYSQMVGRGTRLFPGKEDLLLLDFLWHTERHELCHPANLICESDEVARVMTANIEAAGCPVDIEEAEKKASDSFP